MVRLISRRQQLVATAYWARRNHDKFTYSEGADRMGWLHFPPKTLPWTGDCSSFVTYCYWCAGLPDPNKLGYNGTGYTGTLIAGGKRIFSWRVKPGDVVIYGANPGDHTALIVEKGRRGNHLTISMGQQGDPSLVRVKDDGRPFRFFRYITNVDSANLFAGVANKPSEQTPKAA